MNISSVLIVAKNEDHEQIKNEISKIKLCSVELCEDDKIIVLIESENLEDELSAYKALERIKKAISVSMVFSYQDLDEDIKKASASKDLANELHSDKNAKDIEYFGNVFQKY